ncbi:MAG: DciA family protein [Candidatus Chromulinivorax sp.]
MENIKNLLDTFIKPANIKDAWKLNLIKNWSTIIGNLQSKVCLQKIHTHHVVLGVYDTSWMQELYLLSTLILKKINNHLDSPRISSIRFVSVQPSDQEKNRFSDNSKSNSSFFKKVQLSIIEKKALNKIKDQELAVALENFLQRCLQ